VVTVGKTLSLEKIPRCWKKGEATMRTSQFSFCAGESTPDWRGSRADDGKGAFKRGVNTADRGNCSQEGFSGVGMSGVGTEKICGV